MAKLFQAFSQIDSSLARKFEERASVWPWSSNWSNCRRHGGGGER